MMVVGTYSGKEFVVEDKGYTLVDTSTGEKKQVFVTKDRIITVREDAIEYWNEVKSDEYLERITGLVGYKPVDHPNKFGVDVV